MMLFLALTITKYFVKMGNIEKIINQTGRKRGGITSVRWMRYSDPNHIEGNGIRHEQNTLCSFHSSWHTVGHIKQ